MIKTKSLYQYINFSLMAVSLWSNFFIIWSRFNGVTKTIRRARHLALKFPLKEGSLDIVSDRIDFLLKHLSFLFLCRKQVCLIRGFLLYFYGKRLGINVCLHFGSQWEQGKLKNHCWIIKEGAVCYEIEKVIKDYVTIIEYS